ncbi:hypothetical protein PMAYCL1PPCAC_23651 [Pristionchus mayeri]|uniref:Uncharacterized protein n=1 Tax=Pristionchus mayeri TaxID=1317129 RepID=A0AAN5CZ81_9BILA|nr:hypothetical protein PMAYCL1PPCAC_23651 [Pristionchus mayeri]
MTSRSVVRVSRLPILPKKRKADGEPLPLVYQRRVRCVGGNGGDGMVSFFRGYRNPFGGPDGGDGGNGGHVVFRGSTKVGDLSHLRSELRAERGEFGRSKSQHGKNGEHVEIPVPIGTSFTDLKTNQEIGRLSREGDIVLAARGGIGGHGNEFYLSNSTRKPYKAEMGGKGEENTLHVEMRLMAAAALVGFPNAGKSSLLRAISRARPKVAMYPFTTLKPHVGIVHYEDEHQVSVADIPGLIEGAHMNIGLGHSFLAHLTKCQVLVFVIDLSLQDVRRQRDSLREELSLYSSSLASKPALTLLNKTDIVSEKEKREGIDAFSGDTHDLFTISAKDGSGIMDFLVRLREMIETTESENAVDTNE